MGISREALCQWLNFYDPDAGKDQKITTSNTGPGQLNRAEAFYSPDEQPFLQVEDATPVKNPNMLVISNSLLALRPLHFLDHILIDALLAYYDVYFMPTPPKTLKDCKKIKDAAQFIAERKQIEPADEKSARDIFAKTAQALPASVIDYIKWEKLIVHCRDYLAQIIPNLGILQEISVSDADELNLENVRLPDDKELPRIVKAVNARSINKISLYLPKENELQFFLQNFKNATFEIARLDSMDSEQRDAWWAKHLPKFHHRNLSIKNTNSLPLTINPPGPSKITILSSFYITFTDPKSKQTQKIPLPAIKPQFLHVTNNNAEQKTKVGDIVYIDDASSHADFKQDFSQVKWVYINKRKTPLDVLAVFPNIQGLVVESSSGINLMPSKKCNKLEYLIMRNMQKAMTDFFYFPNLKFFSYRSINEGNFCEIKNIQTAEKLNAFYLLSHMGRGDFSDEKIDFTQCKALETLAIITNFDSKEISCENLPNLRDLYFYISCNKKKGIKINAKNCTELVASNFHCGRRTLLLNIEGCAQLRELSLQSAPSAYLIHDNNYFQLRSIEAENFPLHYHLVLNKKMTLPSECWKKIRTEPNDRYKSYGTISVQDIKTMEQSFYQDEIKDEQAYHRQNPQQMIIARQHELDSINRQSPVSCTKLKKQCTLGLSGDQKTYQVQNDTNLKYTILSRLPVDADHYRTFIHDHIIIQDKEITFISSLQKQCQPVDIKVEKFSVPIEFYVDDLKKQIDSDKDAKLAAGIFEGEKLDANEYYALTTPEPVDPKTSFAIYCDSPEKIELFWNSYHQQCYFKLKKPHSAHITILYVFDRDQTHYRAPLKNVVVSPKSLLGPGIIKHIETYKNEPSLKILFDTDAKISLPDKIARLQSFFLNEFKGDDPRLPAAEKLGTIDKVMICMHQKTGSCQWRATAFYLCCLYLNVHSRLVLNEQHAFCEIGGDNGWIRVELGGRERLDLTPPELRINPFTVALKNHAEIIRRAQLFEEQKKNVFLAQFAKKTAPVVIRHPKEIVDYYPLFEIPAEIRPESIYPKLIADMKLSATEDYVYIHNPPEFERFRKAYQRDDKGQRKEVNGILRNLLWQQGGALIVNWSTFTPQQMVTYQSILDEAASTLSGDVFKKPVKVIGLIRQDTVRCEAFASRCKDYKFADSYFETDTKEIKEEKEIKKTKEPENLLEVDLFQHPDWFSSVVEDIRYAGDKIAFTPGPLLSAIAQTKPRVIRFCNPPKDPVARERFNLFFHRLKHERRFFHNGQYHYLPGHITLLDPIAKPHDFTKILSHIEVTQDTGKNPSQERIYLGLYNFHECYESLVVKNKQAITTDRGFLDDKKAEFYVTDRIPRFSWELLLSHIEKHYPTQPFRFVLAPQAAIEGITPKPATKAVVPLQTDNARIIFTNDPDYHALKLQSRLQAEMKGKGKKTYIVDDVTSRSSFQDWIGELKITQGDTVQFDYQHKDILQALREGHHVILNGPLPARLYQQLLPLLNGPSPHIYVNGERLTVTGKLYAVMPLAAHSRLCLMDHAIKTYTIQDYQADLKFDTKQVDKLVTFHDYLKCIPKREGYPAITELTYGRLMTALKTLNNSKIHAGNPLKDVWLSDYKQSDKIDDPQNEDYAFLSVIAKCLFGKAKPTRQHKLAQLFDHIKTTQSDPTHFIWQLLNCLDGPTLVEVCFPHGLNAALDKTQAPPIIYPSIAEAIVYYLTLINKMLEEKAPIKKQTHLQKRNAAVQQLWRETPVLLLKGAAGTGKTHEMRSLKNNPLMNLYNGHHAADVIQFIEDPSAKMKLLCFDEGNMLPPDALNVYKALTRSDKTIVLQGKIYENKLTDRHKVLVTGNPERFPNRHFMELIQQYGRTVCFKMMSDQEMQDQVLVSLKHSPLEKYQAKLIAAYHLAQAYNPQYSYSTRDVISTLKSFMAIVQQQSYSELHTLFTVCVGEFAGTIRDIHTRQKFIEKLANVLEIAPPAAETKSPLISVNKLLIPQEKEYLLHAIEKWLQPDEVKQSAEESSEKIGLLIEGEPGAGKSSICREILKLNEFTMDARDPRKRFVEINAGDRAALETLEQAFKDNIKAIIFNELNCDEKAEQKIIALYEKAKKPAPILFATQNNSDEPGRKSLSPALLNRLTVNYLEPYSDTALTQIAEISGVPSKDTPFFIKAYHESGVTMRTFFAVLRDQCNLDRNTADAVSGLTKANLGI